MTSCTFVMRCKISTGRWSRRQPSSLVCIVSAGICGVISDIALVKRGRLRMIEGDREIFLGAIVF
jgi:hypothetical protein